MKVISKLKKLFKNEVISTSQELDILLRHGLGGNTTSGQSVNSNTALSSSTYYACILVLSQTLAQVPLELYRRKDNDDREKARDHYLYRLLHTKPNFFQTSYGWRETMQGNMSGVGNAYSFINRVRGKIVELLPIKPSRVTQKLSGNYDLKYAVIMADGTTKEFERRDILHIRGHSLDGISGINPVVQHKEAIGLALATEKHGGALFSNGVQPSGGFKHPGKLSDKGYKRLKDSLIDHKGAANSFKEMILEEGMDWVQYSMSNEAAQYLETRKFSVEEQARIFRVPLVLVGHADKAATYASVEQFLLSFSKFTMQPHFVNWEQELSCSLLTEREQEEYYFEFNVDGLLRGDQKTRAQYYKDMTLVNAIVPNEIRQKENLPRKDGLDEPMGLASIQGKNKKDE